MKRRHALETKKTADFLKYALRNRSHDHTKRNESIVSSVLGDTIYSFDLKFPSLKKDQY